MTALLLPTALQLQALNSINSFRYPADDSTDPNDFVARTITEDHRIGPNIALKVMAGDKVNIRVTSWYRDNQSPGSDNGEIIDDLLSALTGGVSALSSGKASSGDLIGSGSSVNLGLSDFLTDQGTSMLARPNGREYNKTHGFFELDIV